jgi:hypothetical protein
MKKTIFLVTFDKGGSNVSWYQTVTTTESKAVVVVEAAGERTAEATAMAAETVQAVSEALAGPYGKQIIYS